MISPESIAPRPSSVVPPFAGSPSSSGDGGFTLSPALLLLAVRKHWVLMVLTLLVCAAGASMYTARQTRIFEAVATVQMDPQPLMPLGNQSGKETAQESFWSNQEYFATQHQILTSRTIAAAVVRRLGLNRDGAFVAMAPPGKKVNAGNLSVDSAAETLRSRLRVKAISDSRLVAVTYRDADPDRAQRIAGAIADAYVNHNLDMTLNAATTKAEWLDTQLGKLKTDLESQEMELHDFKKKNQLLSVSFDDQSNMLRAQIGQLNTTLTELKARREGVSSRLAVLRSINPEDPAMIPQSELFGNAALAPLRASYIQAKKDIERLRALGKGENHPEAQVALADLRASRQALVTELENIRGGVTADLESVTGELNGITTLYETAKSQAMELNLNEVRYTRLRRSKDNTERVFGMVLERSTESGLSKLMPFNNVRVLDRPLRPGRARRYRSPGSNLALGVALGLLLGLVGAVSRELLDRTVRDAADVERGTGLPSLGSLPDVSSRAARGALYYGSDGSKGKRKDRDRPSKAELGEDGTPELLVHLHPKSAAAESARAVSYEPPLHVPGSAVQDAARHERRTCRGQDDGRLLDRHRDEPGRPACMPSRLRLAAAPSSHRVRQNSRRGHHDRASRSESSGSGAQGSERSRSLGAARWSDAAESRRSHSQRSVRPVARDARGTIRPCRRRQSARLHRDRRGRPFDPSRRYRSRRPREADTPRCGSPGDSRAA